MGYAERLCKFMSCTEQQAKGGRLSPASGRAPDHRLSRRHQVHLCRSPPCRGPLPTRDGALRVAGGLSHRPAQREAWGPCAGRRLRLLPAATPSGHRRRPPSVPAHPALNTSKGAGGCAQGLGRADAAGKVPVRRSLRCFGGKKAHTKRKTNKQNRKKGGGGQSPNIKNQNFSRPAAHARGAGGAGSECRRGRAQPPAGAQPRGAVSPRCPPRPRTSCPRRRPWRGRAGRYQVSGAAGAVAAGGPCAGLGAAHAAGRPRSGGTERSAPRRARCPAGEVALRPSLSLVPRRRLLPPPPSLQCASRSFPLFLPARRRSAGARLARAPPRSCSSQEAAAPPRSRRRRFQAAPGPRSASRVIEPRGLSLKRFQDRCC